MWGAWFVCVAIAWGIYIDEHLHISIIQPIVLTNGRWMQVIQPAHTYRNSNELVHYITNKCNSIHKGISASTSTSTRTVCGGCHPCVHSPFLSIPRSVIYCFLGILQISFEGFSLRCLRRRYVDLSDLFPQPGPPVSPRFIFLLKRSRIEEYSCFVTNVKLQVFNIFLYHTLMCFFLFPLLELPLNKLHFAVFNVPFQQHD